MTADLEPEGPVEGNVGRVGRLEMGAEARSAGRHQTGFDDSAAETSTLMGDVDGQDVQVGEGLGWSQVGDGVLSPAPICKARSRPTSDANKPETDGVFGNTRSSSGIRQIATA